MGAGRKILNQMISLILYVLGVFHLYTGFFGTFESFFQRTFHISLALILIFLLYPYQFKNRAVTVLINGVILAALLSSISFFFLQYDYIMTGRFPFVTPLTTAEIILGLIFIILLLEATRKLTGWVLPFVGLIFILYGFVGPYLPGIFSHAGYDLESIVDLNYLGTNGALGIPLGASASYIALFIIFGAFLAKSGVGSLMMDIAMGWAGHTRGGPAKVSVFGSALHGMLSGSAVANVLTVGTTTIPLMKKIGYRPHFAGGVEASASAGSQIMPPVMGIIAFLMAQYTGIPYIQIAGYALLPAILYFWGVWVMVDLEAVKLKLKGLPREELPDWKKSLKKKWHLLLPIIILIFLLIQGFSPAYAVSYSILSIVILSFFRKETRMGISKILEALKAGVKGMLMIAVATATAGIISGMFGLTGLGIRFTALLDELAGGSLVLALVFTAIAAFILGMGLPPSASYIIQVAITIPALYGILEANSNEQIAAHALLLSHMFVMYWASIAVITPPDALAAFAAAGVAQTRPMRTALSATKLAFVAYVVPFLFVLNPAYLMIGSFADITIAVLNGILGVAVFGIVFQGYARRKVGWFTRTCALAAGGLILIPTLYTSIAGILFALLIIFYHYVWKRDAVPV